MVKGTAPQFPDRVLIEYTIRGPMGDLVLNFQGLPTGCRRQSAPVFVQLVVGVTVALSEKVCDK